MKWLVDNLLIVGHGEAIATGRAADPLQRVGNLSFADRSAAGLDVDHRMLPTSPTIDAGAP